MRNPHVTDHEQDPEVSELVKSAGERYPAPSALRRAVLADIRARTGARTGVLGHVRQWFGPGLGQVGVAFATGAVVAFVALQFLARPSSDSTLYALAADHARAVVTASAIEVNSSDKHTVKPWLSAKLGYSPVVVDLADASFPLLGGRRGFLGGVPLAVMVYGFKEHEIDVYAIRPDAGIALPRTHASLDGYHVVTWSVNGMNYVAMSDVDAERLEAFGKLLKSRQAQPG